MNPAVPLLIVEAIEQEPDSVVLISPTLTEYLPRGEPTGPSIYPLAVANWCGCPVYVDPDMMPGCFLLVRRNEFGEHLKRIAIAHARKELMMLDRRHS